MTTGGSQADFDTSSVFSTVNLRYPAQACFILTVPTDILAHIFECFVPPSIGIHDIRDAELGDTDAESFGRKDCPCSTAHADLIAVSQVCRRWRIIALSIRSFWTPIWITHHVHSSDRALEVINRARGNPLEVIIIDFTRVTERYHCNSQGDGAKGYSPFSVGSTTGPMLTFTSIRDALGNFIKSLHISSPISGEFESKAFFREPLPFLESLVLDTLTNSTWGSEYQLPMPLFGGVTPKLRRLSFLSVGFSWDDPLFKNLTYLRLSRERSPWQLRIGAGIYDRIVFQERFFQILLDCPELVTLQLNNVGPRKGTSSHQYIPVPKLRHLTLLGLTDALHCRYILSCLRSPVLQRLEISHSGKREHDIYEVLPIGFALHPLISNVEAIDFTVDWDEGTIEADFIVGDLDNIGEEEEISVFKTMGTMGDIVDVVGKFKYRGLAYDEDDTAHISLFTTFLRQFCPSKASSLGICDLDSSFLHFPFSEFFGHFNAVQELVVDEGLGVDGHLVCKFLASAARDAEHRNAVALPSLRVLTFYYINFNKGFKRLCSFLEHRKRRQLPMEEVEFRNCNNFTSEMSDIVGQLVRDVIAVEDDEAQASSL